MNNKIWTKVFLLLLFFYITVVVSINYFIDPLYLFKKELTTYKGMSNERFTKIEYLKNNYQNYNSYMFGSSRIGVTSPKIIEKYIPNSKFYNFWVSSGKVGDFRIHLEYFIKNKYPINNIYVQIDLDNMYTSKFKSNLHPHVIDKNLKNFYIENLIGFFPGAWKSKLYENSIINRNYYEVDIKSGLFRLTNRDIAILKNHDKYINSEETFKKNNNPSVKFNKKKVFETILKDIIKICNNNNIRAHFFITPHHKKYLDSYNLNEYLDFLKTISKITNYYDFSGYNSITISDYNFYESTHYLSKIGDLIAARIFNDDNVNIPNDFGTHVTKDNINEHLKNREKQVIEYKNLNK